MTSAVAIGSVQELHIRDGLPNFFAKLNAGQEVRIAYLGGSITKAPGWRVYSQQWFAEQYPDAKIKEIFAAIPGTGGELGVCRIDADVMAHKPDLVFVEFCVNGIGNTEERGRQVTEGMIRKIWAASPETDICFVYTLSLGHLDDLKLGNLQKAAGMMESVLPVYGIPSINFATEIMRLLNGDQLIFSMPKDGVVPEGKMLFSNDGTHPLLETGQVLYNEAVIRAMTAMKQVGSPGPHILPAPLESANWSAAKRYPLSKIPKSGAWDEIIPSEVTGFSVDEPSRNFKERFSELWQALDAGAQFTFRFTGTGFGLYGISRRESGAFEVQVDEQEAIHGTLFSIYTQGPGRTLGWFYPDTLASGVHRVRITLLPDPHATKQGFRAKVDPQGLDSRFDRNELLLGDVFVNGLLDDGEK